MARYFLEVMYNGTAFHGSQLQGEQETVQLAINKTLSTILRTPTLSFGASRTDEGVHAFSNFYHFDVAEKLHDNFLYKVNAILPHTIAAKNIYSCGDEMNARFDAITRQYRYRIYAHKDVFLFKRAYHFPYRIQENILNETAAIIKEYDNFETFSKRNTQTKTFICKIHESYWERNGQELHYIVKANRFLRGMVRGLVGTQLQTGRGRSSIQDFKDIIISKDSRNADFSVPGHGLYLEEIKYPDGSLTIIKDKNAR